jgi:hypothetical protein
MNVKLTAKGIAFKRRVRKAKETGSLRLSPSSTSRASDPF